MQKILGMMGIAVAGIALTTATGCKSYWVEADIENRSGETIHELEVDYPTASFGGNALAPGSAMHYRFQIRGNGPVKVEYTFDNGKVAHIQGPNLVEHQKGHLTIRIFPGGKVDFAPDLKPAS